MFGCSRGEKRTGVKEMKLYDSRQAPNPRRTRIFLAEKGITLPTEQVDIMAMQHKTPEYAAINPLQRMPALVLDDGTIITKSIAICRYFEVLQLPAGAEANKPRVTWFLELLDRELAKREFIAGDRYSVADITALIAVDFMKPARLTMRDDVSNVKRWHAAVSARRSASA